MSHQHLISLIAIGFLKKLIYVNAGYVNLTPTKFSEETERPKIAKVNLLSSFANGFSSPSDRNARCKMNNL